MAGQLTWNWDEVDVLLEDARWEAIQRVTVHAHTKIREALSHPRTFEFRKRKRATVDGPKGSLRKVYLSPAEGGKPVPGQPPGLRTGWLLAHVKYELDRPKMTGRIGVQKNAPYGIALELRQHAAYPWLWATIQKIWGQLKALAGTT